MRLGMLALVAAALLAPGGALAQMSDEQIRRALIKESQSRYSGNCPCPYNINRARKPCGTSSAYSKPGGARPLCYDRDVTPGMIEQYRRRR